MTFGRWKDNASKRFFYRQNKPSLLFYPSLTGGLNEVTSLCSHPPSFFGRKCRECILPIQLRFPADVWAHHLHIPTGLLSCLLSFALLCSPLASSAPETESQLSSQSAGSPRPSGSSNHEPADLFCLKQQGLFPPPRCGTTVAMSGCRHERLLNSHFACPWLVSIKHHRLANVGFQPPVFYRKKKQHILSNHTWLLLPLKITHSTWLALVIF